MKTRKSRSRAVRFAAALIAAPVAAWRAEQFKSTARNVKRGSPRCGGPAAPSNRSAGLNAKLVPCGQLASVAVVWMYQHATTCYIV